MRCSVSDTATKSSLSGSEHKCPPSYNLNNWPKLVGTLPPLSTNAEPGRQNQIRRESGWKNQAGGGLRGGGKIKLKTQHCSSILFCPREKVEQRRDLDDGTQCS